MTSLKALLPAALIVAGTAAPSLAQVVGALENTSGDVIVTRGETALAATAETMSLMDGDCITALTDATTSVTLENGCAITLASGESVVVKSTEEACDTAFTTSATSCLIPMSTAQTSLSQLPPPPPAAGGGILGAGSGLGAGAIGIGVSVVAVGATIAIASDDDDDAPASP